MTGRHHEQAAQPAKAADADKLTVAASQLSGASEGFGLAVDPTEPDPLIGLTVAGVTINRLIAVGGMGRVYEGNQERPRRTVAVKFIRPEVMSSRLQRRFEYEMEVLGRLQHPGIANIYSVGVVPMGTTTLPYFVMEFISEARTLTTYANDLTLSTQQRLELFRKVCEAVAHGHQRGVIHRDLKPGNILVDGSGEPKVIDFGIARATDADLAITTIQTDIGQLIGTLPYMSPEQLEADQQALDIRSDVYALGVVLYELLTAKLPYDLRRKAVHEVIRIVREEDPTPITGLNKTLRRDVGLIAGKCLQKVPEGRYSSAAELAADVGRYLAGEPIVAAAPDLWAGVVRLSRRHRAAATAAIVAVSALVVAFVAIAIFAVRTQRAAQAALLAQQAEAQQRSLAEAARARVEAEQRATNRRLYSAQMMRASHFADSHQREFARQVIESAKRTYAKIVPDPQQFPPEVALLTNSLDDAIATLDGHKARVEAVAVDHRGDVFATASFDRTIRLWNGHTNVCTGILATPAVVTEMAFDQAGTRLLTVAADGVAGEWEIATEQFLKFESLPEETWTCLAVSPTGRVAATGSERGVIGVWDTDTGRLLQEFAGPQAAITCLAFHPRGNELASGSADGNVCRWNLDEGIIVNEYTIGQRVNDIEYDATGSQLGVGGSDWRGRVWELGTGHELVFEAGGVVSDIAFAANGTRLVTLSVGHDPLLWDTGTGTLLQRLRERSNSPACVATTTDGSAIGLGSQSGGITLWDAATGFLIDSLSAGGAGITEIKFLPGRLQFLAAGYAPAASRWAFSQAGKLSTLAFADRAALSSCLLSLDGLRLATASRQRGIWIWDPATAFPVVRLPHSGGARTIAVSADGRRLVAGLNDGSVRHWDFLTGIPLQNEQLHDGPVTAVAISPAGDFVVSGSADNTAAVWDVETGRLLARFPGPAATVESVAISPDGNLVAVGPGSLPAKPTKVAIWDLATRKIVREVIVGFHGPCSAVCFSPDGKQFLAGTGRGTVLVYDAESGEHVRSLRGHTDRVWSLSLNRTGDRLFSAAQDGSVRIWDPTTGDEVAELLGHQQAVEAASLSADATQLATASRDGTVRLWGVRGEGIYRNRVEMKRHRIMLEPQVEGWFKAGVEDVVTKLLEAKKKMPADVWREAANLVLIKSVARQNQTPSDAAGPVEAIPEELQTSE